jgi:hypothetical protein
MIVRFYRILQHLSIDIVFGAVILLHFFSNQLQVSVGWPVYILLGSSIWMIYTIDHLRDSSIAKIALRERYVFHAQNRISLRIALAVVCLASVGCLFYLNTEIIVGGFFLALLCLVYILFHSLLAKKGLKELYIAIIYTCGVFLAPIIVSQSFNLYAMIMLLLLSFLNLILFSWFEFEEDHSDSFGSLATEVGKGKLEKIIYTIAALGLALSFLGLSESFIVSAFFIIGFWVLALLILNPSWSKKGGRYRGIADAIFLIPILFELL